MGKLTWVMMFVNNSHTMAWFILHHLFSILLSLVTIGFRSEQEKDLEILILRQQLAILERKLGQPLKPSRIEKLTLAVLAKRLKDTSQRTTHQLRDVIP